MKSVKQVQDSFGWYNPSQSNVKYQLQQAKLYDSILYSIFSVMFIMFGLGIIWFLKKEYIFFYAKFKWKLLAATFALSIPMMYMGITSYDLQKHPENDPILQFVKDEEYTNSRVTTGVLTYFFGILIPTAAQVASLVFGHIKQKKNVAEKVHDIGEFGNEY